MAGVTEETARLPEDCEEEDDEHGSKEKVLQKYFLLEWDLVKSLLDDIVSRGLVSDPSVAHKIRSIMDKYQEQGQLIEPYLETIVSPLMFIIRSKTLELGVASAKILRLIKPICIIIYSLVTVCGYKAVVRFFPHQVSDLELAVSLMEMCHHSNAATKSSRHESTGEMEAKCVMFLWLSILVLVPFDISTVDSSITGDADLGERGQTPLVLKIVGFSKDYLSSAGPMRSMAALVLSKLLTRPDMPMAFSSFVDWTHEVLSSATDDVVNHFRLLGAVEALTAIFKCGGRRLLVDVVPRVWEDSSLLIKSGVAARSTLLKKYLMKLTQRIGFICLPHRIPSWRYVSKTTSLGNTISASKETDKVNAGANVDGSNSEESPSCPEDEDMDVPEIVEEIMEMLLTGLRDMDTVVRWSAAKGIGRITSRLTSALSEEVLSSVLELFSPGEGDGSWHGGCLALAELVRRGLILPSSLPRVIPVVMKALHYDIRRGPHSVGSHVRDAAAYVCWALGRAYYHSDVRNAVDQLAPHLLTVACYDREVNCRRAAAAAFQENVGRQGNYPHGIDIVNTADYFSLSSRINSYMHVAVFIAQFEGYLYPFAEELLYKICHWEKGLRELASEALSALVKYDPAYFANFVLEKLTPCTLSPDLCMRHGATLALGELVLALYHCDYTLSIDQQKAIANVVPAIEKARLYRGKGGEIMRSAVSRFIECISAINVPLTPKIKRGLLDTVNENLRHPNNQIQDAAVRALKQFAIAYIVTAGTGGGGSDMLSKYLVLLTDQNVAIRRGMALAIAVLPYEVLAKRWKDVLMKLSTCCSIEDNPDDRDAESRVNAVKGLVLVCETLTQEKRFDVDDKELALLVKNEVMTRLLQALDDYSVDKRGDVGSWVREAAMDGLGRCTHILCKIDTPETNESTPLFDKSLATDIIGGLCKQAVEKMDKLREAAVKALQGILYNKNLHIPNILHRKELEKIVPEKSDLRWAEPSFSYPRFVQLLRFSCYSRSLLSGVVISIGGLQESLRKPSISALLEYLQSVKTEDERNSREYMLASDMVWVLHKYRKCDRVIVPSLKTIETLFSNKMFLNMEAQTVVFCGGLLDSLVVELKAAKDFTKLNAGISILGYIASTLDTKINARAFKHLLSFLGHRYPKIRKTCAEQVYLVLLQNANLVDESKIDKSLEIVSESCWDGDIEAVRQQRLELYELVGLDAGLLKKPSGVPKKISETKLMATDENASYSSLVDSSGF